MPTKCVRYREGALQATVADSSGIDEFLRVKLDSTTGKAVLATASEAGVGVAIRVPDTNNVISFFPYTESATLCHKASGAITKYAAVYAAADGKVSSTGTIQIGYAMEAATSAGDIIEVLTQI